jgi:hypothetical protein
MQPFIYSFAYSFDESEQAITAVVVADELTDAQIDQLRREACLSESVSIQRFSVHQSSVNEDDGKMWQLVRAVSVEAAAEYLVLESNTHKAVWEFRQHADPRDGRAHPNMRQLRKRIDEMLKAGLIRY